MKVSNITPWTYFTYFSSSFNPLFPEEKWHSDRALAAQDNYAFCNDGKIRTPPPPHTKIWFIWWKWILKKNQGFSNEDQTNCKRLSG
jgi:hypothetical protein